MWNSLCEYWTKLDVVAKSETARRARLTETDGPGSGISKHRGVSKSVKRLVQEMAKERGVSLKDCAYESFRSIHMKKDGTYVTQKDANLDTKVKEIATQQGEGANLNDIFLNVVSEMDSVKKKRMYGTGSLGPSLLSDGSTVGGSSATSQYLHEPCDHRIGSLEQQIEEEKRAREELQAQVQALVQKMNSQPQNDEDSPHQ